MVSQQFLYSVRLEPVNNRIISIAVIEPKTQNPKRKTRNSET
jgi:hypothetical protein